LWISELVSRLLVVSRSFPFTITDFS
jgi:hypothetical protein